MAAKRVLSGVYENGRIRFRTTIRLGRKLPLRNRTRVRFTLELPSPRDPVTQSFGIIRVPKRLARLVAESPDFSVLNT